MMVLSESQKDVKDRGLIWLTPDDHFHPGSGFISKPEQLALAVMLASGPTINKCLKLIDEKRPEEVEAAVVGFIETLGRGYIDLSGSVDGKRSKQLTKWGSSNAAMPPSEEDKPGWFARNIKRKKGDDLASDG